MNSPFNKSFISKSPLRSHERRLKKLDKKIEKANKYDSHTGDKPYDLLADLQRQRKDLVASHTDTNTKRTEEEDVQVREDEDAAKGSAVEMKSPLHGYVDASDMVDPNPPTAHMWGKVFEAMGQAGHAIVKAKVDKKAEYKKREDAKNLSDSEWLRLYGTTEKPTTGSDTTTDVVDTTATDDTIKTPALDRLKKIRKCQETGGSFSECNEKFPRTTD